MEERENCGDYVCVERHEGDSGERELAMTEELRG